MENSNHTLKRLEPMTIVVEANKGFVNMAEVLMRVLTWNRPFLDRVERKNGGKSSGGKAVDPSGGKQSRQTKPPVLDPKKLEQLKRTVEKLVRPAELARPGEVEASLQPTRAISNEELDKHLRCLFHQDPDIRFDAVSWLRRNQVRAAVPTLEGVLIIEEDNQVRDEIENALGVLNANDKKGDLP